MAWAAPPAAKPPAIKTVAILLFPGVELMDFAGPAEVFIIAERGKAFRVVTVAENTKPLKTMGGITVTPDHSFAEAPRAEIVIVPGGNLSTVSPAGKKWVQKAAGESEITMSVCYGALLLAELGLLAGNDATTHHWALDELKKTEPTCNIIQGKRFVDNGRVITTAGVTAGIDGALRIIERTLGKDAAAWAADEWMEHPRPTLTK